jgi:hypothetical protein
MTWVSEIPINTSGNNYKSSVVVTSLFYFSSFIYYHLIDTFYVKATKGLIAVIPEIDCDQTAMGLLPVTSAVLLIVK